jgi:hypothetical protein
MKFAALAKKIKVNALLTEVPANYLPLIPETQKMEVITEQLLLSSKEKDKFSNIKEKLTKTILAQKSSR